MRRLLIKQALVIPLAAMLVQMLVAVMVPGYSSVSQHLSELERHSGSVAWFMRIAAITNGVSVLLFGVGVIACFRSRLPFTALLSAVLGASMISNGVFIMGGPLHGLYGVGIFTTLVPACFAAESNEGQLVARVSLLAAVVAMFYLWLMFSGLDPKGYRGLTQRFASIAMFAWYSFAAHRLLRSDPR